jgi:hypothetical protein
MFTKFLEAEMLGVLPLRRLAILQACVDHFRFHSYPRATDVLCGPEPFLSSLSHLYHPQFIPGDFPSTQSLPLDISKV